MGLPDNRKLPSTCTMAIKWESIGKGLWKCDRSSHSVWDICRCISGCFGRWLHSTFSRWWPPPLTCKYKSASMSMRPQVSMVRIELNGHRALFSNAWPREDRTSRNGEPQQLKDSKSQGSLWTSAEQLWPLSASDIEINVIIREVELSCVQGMQWARAVPGKCSGSPGSVGVKGRRV